jgi:hypothetical protein
MPVAGGYLIPSATTQDPIMALVAPSTKRGWIVGVRFGILQSSAAAGNSVLFTLARTSTNAVGGTTTNVAAPNDPAGPATPLITASVNSGTAWGTAPVMNAAAVVGQWELPQTTGSSWEEFPPLGYEWTIAASGGYALFVYASVATATNVECNIIWAE